MEIVRPASRRFWEEDKDDEVRVDPPVSPPARQRERRDPGRGREIGEVKIPAQDGQLQSGSSELRKLAFTVEAASYSCPDGPASSLVDPGRGCSWKGGMGDGWVLLRLHEKALLSFLRVRNRSTSEISISISVRGKRRRDFVEVKRGVRLTHGYRYAKDVKIGHLPCVYIRIDCRSSSSSSSSSRSTNGRGSGVSLHELVPVGIPASCVGLYMGPCMEDLTYRSTERLLFGPSLKTSLPAVCSAAAVDRLVLPPSYLRLAEDNRGRGDGRGGGREAAAAVAAAAADMYSRGYGYNNGENGFRRNRSLFFNPGGVVGGFDGGGGDGGDEGGGNGEHSAEEYLYGHDNVDGGGGGGGGGSIGHDEFDGGNVDGGFGDGAGDFEDGDDHVDSGDGSGGGGHGGGGGGSYSPRSYANDGGNSVPDPRYSAARKHALQTGRLRTGARTGPNRGSSVGPPLPAPGYRGTPSGNEGGNFGGYSGGNAHGNYGRTNGGNPRGDHGGNNSGNHGGTARGNSRGIATARPRGMRDRATRGIGAAVPMTR